MPKTDFSLRRGALLAAVIALLLTLALVVDATPLLRGGAGWRWPYELPSQPLKLLPGMIALIAYLLLGSWWMGKLGTDPADHKPPHAFILFALIGGLAVQLAFLAFYGNPLEQLFFRTVSTLSGGFYEVGVAIEDIPSFLRSYPDVMVDWSAHPRAHPPGTVLSFWTMREVFSLLPGLSNGLAGLLRPLQCHHRVLMALPDEAISAASLGMILPLLGLLSLWPLYDLVRRVVSREAALRAVLWLPLIPAYVMFTPQWNQFHILWTMIGLWLLHRALSEISLSYFGLAGIWLSLATFQSFTNINLLGMLCVFGLVYLLVVGRVTWNREDWIKVATGVLLFTAGMASLWVIYGLVFGYTPFLLLSRALTIHYELQEPYLPWLFFFPMDLFLFSGLAFSIIAVIESIRALVQVFKQPSTAHADAVFPLTLLISVLGLTLSGTARGEVGRLMLVIMPLVVITASQALSAREKRFVINTHAISLAHGVQLIAMVGVLRVIGTELAPAPNPPFMTEPPPMQHVTQADFAGSAELIGYDAGLASSGDALELTLYWRSTHRFDHAYFVGAIVLGPDGALLGVLDWLPADGAYPTSCWRPGEVVLDQIEIPLDAVPAGDYWVSISLFDFTTRQPLPVITDGREDTQIGIGPIPIP